MWTPKRILILLGGLTLFVAGYFVYSYFLGGIDGLPVLTADYLPQPPGKLVDPEFPENIRGGETERKINYAFHNGCEEATRKIKIDLRSRGVILAAEFFDIMQDGRVKLQPFSAAIFKEFKENGVEVSFPEINTVKADYALLTLDKPVSNMAQLSNCKIIGVELIGKTSPIILNHNRRTPEQSDDLEVSVNNGSMFYEEKTNLIWTDGFVQLFDFKTEPYPTKITAKGMKLHLADDTGPNRPKNTSQPSAKEKVGGPVEMIILKNNVDMSMYLDADAGFPAGPGEVAKDKPALAKGEVAEKSHVVIKTNGPFHYDLKKDLAWFDSPPPTGAAGSSDQVLVIREHKAADGKKYDQLLCNHLELQFRKRPEPPKSAGPPKQRDPSTPDKEIATALATANTGEQVLLTMDSENLHATGSELHYISPSTGVGPQTILKGAPLRANKDGHKIMAQELRLVGAVDKTGSGQRAYARGPGQIDVFDKTKTDASAAYSSHAKWKDNLIIIREREGEKSVDVITMTGSASFEDDASKQALFGERLQVTVESGPQAGDEGKKFELSAGSAAKQHVRLIEAFEKVRAYSPDYILRQANHMAIFNTYAAGPGTQLPDIPPPPAASPPRSDASARLTLSPNPTVTAAPAAKINPPQATPPSAPTNGLLPAAKKTGKPMELWAEDVVAYMVTQGEKRELKELRTERAVHVLREAEETKDKKASSNAVDITGEMLQLEHHPGSDAHTLSVYGDARKPAQLMLGEMLIIGPKVTINQKENIAEVVGEGAMSMPSDASFEGGKTGKTKTLLKVHWSKDMIFDGKQANFYGHVQAFQDDAAMRCEHLTVTLDRVVSFKEGQKDNQNAAVDKLLCDRSVLVEDTKRDAAGKRVQFDRMEATLLNVDKRDGPIIAHGPGKVEHLAAGDSNDPFGGPARQPKEPTTKKVAVTMLTRIKYDGWMNSNNKDNTRNAKFYDNVEVFYFASEDVGARMDPDKPPKGGFYMHCNNLSVYSTQVGTKKNQLMVAENNVFFRTDEYFGRASVVKFNESEDMVILEGSPGNMAMLTKAYSTGNEPGVVRANQIMYNRKTGQVRAAGVSAISGGN